VKKEFNLAVFVRLEDSIKDAILTIMKYVKVFTGEEPTQEEIAEMLKSYFILNEVGNQIKYQLKKESEKEKEDQIDIKNPAWTLNLKSGPVYFKTVYWRQFKLSMIL
jgi:hypothetical protein